jgi:hypothetical protein
MTSYRGTRNDGGTDSNSSESLDAPVCSSPDQSSNEEASALPPRSGNPREFLGRSALRLLWLPAHIVDRGGRL